MKNPFKIYPIPALPPLFSPFCGFILAAFLITLRANALATLTVYDLRCEYLCNPEGILGSVNSRPRLSWKLESSEPNQYQTAYRIIVASSPSLLEKEQPDLWDTGKVQSDETTHIVYGGKPLPSFAECYWRVMVWDSHNRPSKWSKIAKWSTGPASIQDWGNAVWIGLDGIEKTNWLSDTWWIWHPNDPNPQVQPQKATNYFRRLIFVHPHKNVKRAIFQYAGDDMCRGWLNGSDLGARKGYRTVKYCDITYGLVPGTNVLGLTGYKWDTNRHSAGIVGSLLIEYEDGTTELIPTDERWRVWTNEVAGWLKKDFDDSSWPNAKIIGPVGMEPWGKVQAAEDRTLPARWVRKEFVVKKPISTAKVYYSGLGLSELYINGHKVGDKVLSPALSYYSNRVYYVAEDVTRYLKRGSNAIGVILGNGRFYADRSRVYAGTLNFGFPKLLLKMRIQHTDGSTTEIVSDESWKITDQGPIRANSEFDGEEYDARLEMDGWANPGFDDSKWYQAQIVSPPAGILAPQMTPPIKVIETIKPISVREVAPGIHVFDMGQNIVGWCRLKVRGPAGTTVRIRHAERLNPDGTLYMANYRGARATDLYILRGSGLEIYEPRFTYRGFRYVEIKGYPGKPTLDSIEGRVVHDDLEPTGVFTCSHPLVNKIFKAAVWGIRGNYRSIPTDCPQRDERQGWLGDRSQESIGESYLFCVAPFYRKWLYDIIDSQRPNGSIPNVAPPFWPIYTDNVTWPSTFIFVSDMLLRQYGDTHIISEIYEPAEKWINYMQQFSKNNLIDRDSYGDWCVPPEHPNLIHTKDTNRITSGALLASAYFYQNLKLMAEYATMLGKTNQATMFAGKAEALKKSFNERFLDQNKGRYDNGTATSSLLPLAFAMVPEEFRGPVFGNLVDKILNDFKGHIPTGVIGCQFLMRTLTQFGRGDIAWMILTNETYPGWGYMIKQGATTIWELWNGDTADPQMNSGNHVMLIGDLIVWMFEDLAGIRPDPEIPGFKHIIMKPTPIPGLTYVEASYKSIRGLITSRWETRGQEFTWHVTLPPNTSATVWIPSAHPNTVKINGKTLGKSTYAKLIGYRTGYTICKLGNGSYTFTSK